MEFPNRKACIDHYEQQFPNIPRYVIEMALDYDLANEGQSTEKPLTGKQKRKQKKTNSESTPVKREINRVIQDALENGKPLEIDCATVVKGEDYNPAPPIKGFIDIDGEAVAKSMNNPESTSASSELSTLTEIVESDEINL